MVSYTHIQTTLLLSAAFSIVQAPPREPPAELLLNFTQNGKIPLKSYYVDDSNKGKGGTHLSMVAPYRFTPNANYPLGTHYKFSRKDVEARISQARSIVREVLRNPPPNPPSAISHGMWMSQLTDLWLIHALDRYGVEKKDIVRVCMFILVVLGHVALNTFR